MNRYTFTTPPRAVRQARPDNLALVPASLLPFKAIYQQIANDLPAGSTLIVIPKSAGRPSQTLENVATQIEAKGHQVTIVAADRLVIGTL